MRAARYYGRRDLRIENVPEPGQPAPGELLLRVVRGAICGTDVTEYLKGPLTVPLHQRHANSGHLGPMIIGHEMLGEIVALGDGVEDYKVGQRVVPGAGIWCGTCEWCLAGRPNLCARYYTMGLNIDGGMAEWTKAPARICKLIPQDCPDNTAAMAQPLSVALHAVRRSGALPGQTIALVGVGAIGAFILSAVVSQGLGPVIALDVDNDRLEKARKLGAGYLVNSREQDPVEAVRAMTAGAGVDIVIEASGAPPAPALAMELVKRGGRILIVGMQAEPRALDLHELAVREIEITSTNAHVCDVDLPEAIKVLATSNLAPLMLDRVLSLDELVSEGIMAMAEGRARGKILVDPSLS